MTGDYSSQIMQSLISLDQHECQLMLVNKVHKQRIMYTPFLEKPSNERHKQYTDTRLHADDDQISIGYSDFRIHHPRQADKVVPFVLEIKQGCRAASFWQGHFQFTALIDCHLHHSMWSVQGRDVDRCQCDAWAQVDKDVIEGHAKPITPYIQQH